MTPDVCQGLQSCLQPRLIEPRALRHRLTPPKPSSLHSFPWSKTEHPEGGGEEEEEKKRSYGNNDKLGGWSFILALTNTPQNGVQVTDQKEKAYVHPRVKPSSSALSSKSLEMCTESLGSESSNDFFPLSGEDPRKKPRSKSREFAKKTARSGSFPPPLTSIAGSNGVVKVRTHREGGRLVIKAITAASQNTCFQAERVDGRLRLCLVKESSGSLKRDEEGGGDEVEVAERVVEEHNDENGDDGDDDDGNGNWVEDISGNSGNVGVKLRFVGGNGCQLGGHFEWPLLKAVC